MGNRYINEQELDLQGADYDEDESEWLYVCGVGIFI